MKISHDWDERSLDTTLSMMADQHRRLVVAYLGESDTGVASCEELAEYITTQCEDETDPETLRIRLHHSSLPKLESASFLDYDPQRRIATYQPRPDVEALIEQFGSIEL